MLLMQTPDSFVTRIAKPVFHATFAKALRLLEERSMRPGRGNHHYWYISAAISLVTIQYEPENTRVLERQASDRVCKLLYQILSLQDEDGEVLAQEVILGETSGAAMDTPASFVDQSIPMEVAGFPPATTNGFGELEGGAAANGWMLDDLWFLGDLEGGLIRDF
ncbi:hypothetical protein N0V90_001877 [Kalmusia sp. IMI 367209]|nr:hypothetical protein N0V90_001877 [Kalmusia sp. IMI 367209]